MKSLSLLWLLALLIQLHTYGQLKVFGPVAESLQQSTINTYGIPAANYWWCAHGIDVLVDGYLRTRSPIYKTRIDNLLTGIRSFNGNTFSNNFNDDMEWLGIACVNAYLATADHKYLSLADTLWNDIIRSYSNNAINWKKDCVGCKNTCANTPAVILAVRLYRITGDAGQLQKAQDIFAFVKNNLVDPVSGAVWDAKNVNTGHIGKAVYSYNEGTYIGAAWELYKITGDTGYLNQAVRAAEYAMNNRRPNGLLFGDETGSGDGGLFKGIFMRYFALLAKEGNLPPATRDRYTAAILFAGNTLRTQGINTSTNLVSTRWWVPPTTIPDYSTQLSGVMMIELAAWLD